MRPLLVVLALLCAGLAGAGPNLCAPETGAVVSASSTLSDSYPVAAVTDGLHEVDSGYWNDATPRQYPDWVMVTFPRPVTLDRVLLRLPVMPYHAAGPRTIGEVAVQVWDEAAQDWVTVAPQGAEANPLRDWVAPTALAQDNARLLVFDPVTTTRVRALFIRGQSDGWSFLEELAAYCGPPDPPAADLPVRLLAERAPVTTPGRLLWRIGELDGAGAELALAQGVLSDVGRYQDGGYWATPLAWFMEALGHVDPALAARTFCDAVADFQAQGDLNEWINDGARGVRDYNASAAMPLAGAARLRAYLRASGQRLPEDLQRQLDAAVAWLEPQADRIIRGSSRVGRNGVRIFTPDATGGYGAFWVRDWSYSLEGRPQACTPEEIRSGYLFLAAAQRADGCMPDRVRPDGVGIYSPGGEANPFSTDGSTDQSPFMVLLCHQCWKLGGDLEPFRQTAARLEKAMRFTPRNPANGLVWITDPQRNRPYSFMDAIPLRGDEQFTSVVFWDACGKLAEMYEAAGDAAAASRWRREAQRVCTGLQSLWEEKRGVFLAASEHWPQPSVWGSAYAVYAGVATPHQTRRIAAFLRDNYDLIVKRGQIRHLLRGTYWGRPEPQRAPATGEYLRLFPEDVTYTVGRSDPARDFPALQPGTLALTPPQSHPFRVQFHLDALPARPRLVVGLLADESYRTRSSGLTVEVNGKRTAVELPGIGRPELKRAWPAALEFALPPGTLRLGENTLTLTAPGLAWLRYDGLALVADR